MHINKMDRLIACQQGFQSPNNYTFATRGSHKPH